MPLPAIGMGNTVVKYNGNTITSYCNQADLQGTLDALDVTNLASDATETINPVTTWTIRLGGFWEYAIDNILGPDAVTPGTKRDGSVQYFDSGGNDVEYAWTANAEIGNYQIQSQPKQAKTFTAELRLSGAPTRTATPAA